MALLAFLLRAFGVLVALGAVGLPLWSLRAGRRRQRELLDRAAEPPADAPPATVIVPVRGRHQGLDANVEAILDQDHPDLEWLFVVDDAGDPATPILREALEEAPDEARLVVVDDEAPDVGAFPTGKSRAHAAALRHVRPASEVLLFADADARPRPDWARRMTGPLAEHPGPGDPDAPRSDRPTGAVTAYRWYVSEDHGFWSRLRAQWNGSGHAAMLQDDLRFCWGGSMAIRRDVFERCRVVERMRTMLSDDVALTAAVRDAGYAIRYAPRASSLCIEDCDREACVEWCVRQSALTRVGMPRLWRLSVAAFAAAVGAFAAGSALLGFAGASRDPWALLVGASLLVPVLVHPLRTRSRWRFFREAMAQDGAAVESEPDLPFLALAQPFFMLYVLLRSARIEEIEWRGRTYDLEVAGGVA